MMRRWLGIMLMAGALSLAVGAAESSRWGQIPAKDHVRVNPLAGQPETIRAGALVYREHCMECHKADARGDGRKKPSLHSERLRTASDGDIEWFLRQGDLGHGMPSWSRLPEAQRWQVVAYLKSIQ